MGAYDFVPDPGPVVRRLSPDEKARVLGKLYRLETAAMLTPEWDRVSALLEWAFYFAGSGMLRCEDVGPLAAEFRRWGID